MLGKRKPAATSAIRTRQVTVAGTAAMTSGNPRPAPSPALQAVASAGGLDYVLVPRWGRRRRSAVLKRDWVVETTPVAALLRGPSGSGPFGKLMPDAACVESTVY